MFQANNTKIILHQDIDALYNRFVELNGRFSDSYKKINKSLRGITDSYRRSGGKDTIVKTCQKQSQNLLGVCDVLEEGAALLKYSRDTLRNLDSAIRDKIDDAEFPLLRGFAPGDAGDPNTQVWPTNNDYWYSMLGQTAYWDPAWEQRAIGYFDKGQCTWYAYIRFMSLYPDAGLGLGAASGNAGQWLDNNQGREHLEIVKGGWDTLNTDRLPCIAASSGHVYIVEGVTRNDDGSIKEIIYSECNGYNHEQRALSNNDIYNEGVDCVFDKATPDQLNLNGFIYYSP